jgi:capsular exopolysaccharide synthesis family protein
MAYARTLRRRWRLVLGFTLAAVSLAAAVTLLTPRTYQSSAKFFVSTSSGEAASNAQLASGNTFTQQRVKSYVLLLKTPKTLDLAAAKVPGATAVSLAPKITGSIPPDSVLLDVTVRDRSPERAKAIAEAVAQVFPSVVEELERVDTSSPSPVKLTVVKSPAVPGGPIAPRPARNLALGLLLGLMGGAGAAVLRDLLDTKVRTKEDVENLTEATILGGIPFDPDAAKHPLIVQADPQAGRAEAFRAVRTNLRFVDLDHHPRTFLVTSSVAREGKSITSANLALTLAESGVTTCVIEGDLRRPRLLEYMGLQGSVGLTDLLIGRYELDDVLQDFGRLPLAILGAGPTPPNPSELLGSAAMKDLLEQLKERFEYVLIDAPPLLPVTDSAILSTMVDGTIVVAGSGVVTRDQLDTALDNLANVSGRLSGIVLNRIPRSRGAGYYDYRYGYKPERTNERSGKRRSVTVDTTASTPNDSVPARG